MKTVLFVCTENAGRSQMAEALFNRPAPDDLRAESAGQCPRWAVTLACGASCPYVPTAVEDWDIPDPAGKSLDDVRAIRDQIELRVRDLIEHRTDAIRADPTAHELRLTHLLPDLIERFPELPAEQIRAVADDVLAELADAPVRSFVMTLADRKARERLSSQAPAHVCGRPPGSGAGDGRRGRRRVTGIDASRRCARAWDAGRRGRP